MKYEGQLDEDVFNVEAAVEESHCSHIDDSWARLKKIIKEHKELTSSEIARNALVNSRATLWADRV